MTKCMRLLALGGMSWQPPEIKVRHPARHSFEVCDSLVFVYAQSWGRGVRPQCNVRASSSPPTEPRPGTPRAPRPGSQPHAHARCTRLAWTRLSMSHPLCGLCDWLLSSGCSRGSSRCGLDQPFVAFHDQVTFRRGNTRCSLAHSGADGHVGCSTLWLLCVVLWWTDVCELLCEHMFPFLVAIDT